MSDDDSSGNEETVTVSDLGESDGHTTRKGRFNSDDEGGDSDESE
jgi:hypothetical protein